MIYRFRLKTKGRFSIVKYATTVKPCNNGIEDTRCSYLQLQQSVIANKKRKVNNVMGQRQNPLE